MGSAAMFFHSASAFHELVAAIGDEQWEQPALGEWSLRSLVGHTTRAILTVESYLQLDDPGFPTVPSAEGYYARVYRDLTDPAAVAARGVEAGVWLGDDPAQAVADALTRTMALVDAAPPERIVSIGGLGIELGEYLRTRVFELVVHSIDISRATGLPHGQPPESIRATLELAAGVAAAKGDAETLLLALTGRGELPAGYSVV
ncbi:maleylpyruvate isomerase family mycothiol-dependent enzyme [Herbiconiux sp. KACC 21604]|uniref:maleylpyruvate isomerase family mycothiol-dependent enzyme n=1 Tax=unclassified Herbiconiux TaxID=2618217 RepID=UPI00149211DC|nr:maleylpyruvate isomerase family mycothiol-dependent enzyme [Herbiconiux sp. SALV-R1]QJU55009.1 maleylpyruvate isomerase family mycothiol-dependent enzyme [Herbiconiux sp. SALV-R1]WPO86144.1 maleylpyruvate isomerase family mycothiol-dependent enzyme [Herbiconiux sp. KACC 21604]